MQPITPKPAPKLKRGVLTIADLRARSRVDPITHCWHWQGGSDRGRPKIHTLDLARGEKRTIGGPSAVWNIAHGAVPPGAIPYRRCVCTDCVNPTHLGLARSRAELGAHIARSGVWRNPQHLEARMVGLRAAFAVTGKGPTPPEVLRQVVEAPLSESNRALARRLGLTEQLVSKHRRRAHGPHACAAHRRGER